MTNDYELGEAALTGRTVVGLFADGGTAERAIRELGAAGFPPEAIGVALRHHGQIEEATGDPIGEASAEGAQQGALSGGVVGGVIGLLGSLLLPGVGPIIVGGLLATTLAGAGIGAATGSLIGALVGVGASEEQARHFAEGFTEGSALVTVSAGERTPEAIRILEAAGADLGPAHLRAVDRLALADHVEFAEGPAREPEEEDAPPAA